MRAVLFVAAAFALSSAAFGQSVAVPQSGRTGVGATGSVVTGNITTQGATSGTSFQGTATLNGALAPVAGPPPLKIPATITAARPISGGPPPTCSSSCWADLKQCLVQELQQSVTDDVAQTHLNQAQQSYDPNGQPPCAVDHQRCVARCPS